MNEEEKINQPTNDNQSSIENENVSAPSTINEQPSTENMEVHKHPHHVIQTEYICSNF